MAERPPAHASHEAIVAFGANIPGAWGEPRQTCRELPRRLAGPDLAVLAVSPLYETEPVGPAPQPLYLNGVLVLATALAPEALLRRLKDLERAAGRVTLERWGARPLDLDIIALDGLVQGWQDGRPSASEGVLVVPHGEMHRRGFVLRPLADVRPGWRHPVLGATVEELLAGLADQGIVRVVAE
jgi:2-amino-4-hydroxy-6-hydroxymethyldihydropteridine diphosphokinase